jgi:hypothetical protein
MAEQNFIKLGMYLFYHHTWTHLNGVLHKSLPLVCVSVCVSFPSLLGKDSIKCNSHFIVKQRFGKHVTAATNNVTIEELLDACACESLYVSSYRC